MTKQTLKHEAAYVRSTFVKDRFKNLLRKKGLEGRFTVHENDRWKKITEL